MIRVNAKRNRLEVKEYEFITSGAVKVYRVQFEFSDDWEGLTRTAVFKACDRSRSVLLDESSCCVIPWEVTAVHGVKLYVGVQGTNDEGVVLTTEWADLTEGSKIASGAAAKEGAKPPTPDLWQQELAGKQDKLHGAPSQVVGFDEDGSAVPQDASGGGGGAPWGVGRGLKVVNGDLTVNTTDDFKGDNTLPMTAAGVQTTVGNIEALLGTI